MAHSDTGGRWSMGLCGLGSPTQRRHGMQAHLLRFLALIICGCRLADGWVIAPQPFAGSHPQARSCSWLGTAQVSQAGVSTGPLYVSRSDIMDAVSPPLLITIGPQCCGKTTLLRRLNTTRTAEEPAVMDVSIDDDREVYLRVPMDVLLQEPGVEVIPRMVFGRTLADRLEDQAAKEARIVMKVVAGRLSLSDAEAELRNIAGTADVREDLLFALQKVVSAGTQVKSKTCQLFIPEAMRRGIIRSTLRLEAALVSHQGAVSWGNTNSKAKDYKSALAAAEVTGRRVVFLRWGHEIRALPLFELLTRNIYRCAKSGKYIPAKSIQRAVDRTEFLLRASNSGDTSGLMSLAGFTLDSKGRPRSRVAPLEEAPPLVRPVVSMDEGFGGLKREGGTRLAWMAAAAALGPAVGVGLGEWGVGEQGRGEQAAAEKLSKHAREGLETLLWGRRVRAAAQYGVEASLVFMANEWRKFRYWSRNSARMELDWRLSVQKAKNMTEPNEENGFHHESNATRFDWEKWQIIKTLSGYGRKGGGY